MNWSGVHTRLKQFQIYLIVAILFIGSIGLIYAYRSCHSCRSHRILTEPAIIIQKNTFGISNDGTYGHDLWFKNLGETAYSPRMTDYSVSRPSGLESVIAIVSFGDSLPNDAVRHTLIEHINPGDLRDALVICFDYKTGTGRYHRLAYYYQSSPPTADARDWSLRELDPNTLASIKRHKICEPF